MPAPVFVTIDVDDAHDVAITDVPPTCTISLRSDIVICALPTTVTLDAPVVGALVITIVLMAGPSIVNTMVTLPACSPAVSVTPRLLPTPALDRPVTALSEIHDVAVDMLPPSAASAL